MSGTSLDPDDWGVLRALGHRMLDDVFDDLAGLPDGPVWRPMPPAVRDAFQGALPRDGANPETVYADYRRLIAPFGPGNRHGQFFGWVQGGGTAIGVLAEMLAAGLNANCGGRDHAPIACERQVVAWAAEMLGFPADASGLLTTGTSMGNFMAVLAAREAASGGAGALTAYASAGAHLCVARALKLAGLGDALRLIPCDARGRMDLGALHTAIGRDRAAGRVPFLIVGTAGGVDTGAFDDLAALADVAAAEALWLHVDAAFGALATLSDTYRPLCFGIERAESVAFDWHKWAQVPYDSGCVVFRDAAAHRAAFAREGAPYLAGGRRGLAAGAPWPVDLGPELSRGFRALKVWMTLRVYGADRLGAGVDRCCALARRMADAIDADRRLERCAPVALNIVCFRYTAADDAGQAAIAADLQEAGEAVFSTTVLDARTVLRAAIVNHRTTAAEVDAALRAVLAAGDARAAHAALREPAHA